MGKILTASESPVAKSLGPELKQTQKQTKQKTCIFMDSVVGYEAIQTTNQQPNSSSFLIYALSHTTALWRVETTYEAKTNSR